jgi:hypothetical protein
MKILTLIMLMLSWGTTRAATHLLLEELYSTATVQEGGSALFTFGFDIFSVDGDVYLDRYSFENYFVASGGPVLYSQIVTVAGEYRDHPQNILVREGGSQEVKFSVAFVSEYDSVIIKVGLSGFEYRLNPSDTAEIFWFESPNELAQGPVFLDGPLGAYEKVPEPSNTILLCTGGLLAARCRRR